MHVYPFKFKFIITGISTISSKQLAALEDNPWSDIFVSDENGRHEVLFLNEEGPTALETMKKAYRKLRKAVPGVHVLYVDEDLVGLADIASRTGKSKKDIKFLIKFCDLFPTPVGIDIDGRDIWRWQDVYTCVDAMTKSAEWSMAGDAMYTRVHDYGDAANGEGEPVDRQSVAAFQMFLYPGTETQKPVKKKQAKKKPTKKNSR